MSRQYNIRWTPDDEKELKRIVKNFNAKITRLEKKNPKEKGALPERESVKHLKQLISTRADLKRELNSLKRFSQKGAEEIITAPDNKYNLKLTKWQKEEMTRRAGVVNRRRKQRLKEISEEEVMHRGKKLGYKKGELGMGSYDENSLKPINAFTPSMNRADLKAKSDVLKRESQSNYWKKREDLHKANYIKSLEENLGGGSDVKQIIRQIEGMSYDQFRKIFESENAIMEHSYPLDDEQRKEEIEFLKSVWMPKKITVKRRKQKE